MPSDETSFNTCTSPKAGATCTTARTRPAAGCFNTRTSPKAGATRPVVLRDEVVEVSTHAPARRPVRPLSAAHAQADAQFQHTHQPEGRCDNGSGSVWRSARVSTHAPARRPVRHCPALEHVATATVSTHAPARRPVRPLPPSATSRQAEFQHTHQPEGRCDSVMPGRIKAHACFNTRTSPKAGATMAAKRKTRYKKFQHTHQPEGRCDTRRPTAARRATGFNTRTSPKAGATRGRCIWRTPARCFNTRTSPKAGATEHAALHRAEWQVSTHAPARRPVRPQRFQRGQ